MLGADHFLSVEAEQMGIDITLRLYGPSGRLAREVDSPNGSYGPETLFWVSDGAGLHRIEIAGSGSSTAVGAFRLKILRKISSATESDRAAVSGQENYLRALSLNQQGKRAEAEAAFKAAVVELLGSGRNRLGAQVLRVYASMLSQANRYEDALQENRRALFLAERAGDFQEQEIIWGGLGRDYKRLGRYPEARTCYERALAVDKHASDPSLLGNTLHDYGTLFLNSGAYDRANTLLERALRIYEASGNRPAVRVTLGDLGTAANFLSHYEQALGYCTRSMDANLGGRASVPALLCEGTALRGLNRYDEALRLFDQAGDLAKRSSDRRQQAVCDGEIALTLWHLGEFETALSKYADVLATARGVKDSNTEAATLTSMAHCYRRLNRNTEALDAARQAQSIAVSIGNANIQADALNSLGQAYLVMKQHHEALATFRQALQIYHRSKVRTGEAAQLRNIGAALLELGDDRAALDAAYRGFEAAVETGDDRNQGLSLSYMMTAWRRLGQSRLAVFLGKQAVDALQRVRAKNQRFGPDSLGNFVAANGSVYRNLADLLISLGRLGEAQQVLDLMKSREYQDFLRSDASDSSSSVTLTPEERLLESEFDQIRDRLATIGKRRGELISKISVSREDEAELNRLEHSLESGNQHFLNVLNGLAAKTAGAPGDADRIRRVREMRGIMPELRQLPVATVLVYTLLTEERYVAVLFTPDIQKVYEYRISPADLSRKVYALREAVGDPRRDPRPAAQELYRILVGPEMESDLHQTQAKIVMWELDGVLRYVPIAALHSGKRYFIEDFGLAVFTPTALPHMIQHTRPDLKATGFGVTKPHPGFDALPNVNAELSAIIRQDDSPKGVLPGEKLMDESFTLANFRSRLRMGAPVVHVASHFHFEPANGRKSALLLGDGSMLSMAEMQRMPNIFEHVELLTLSACETGLGDSAFDGAEVEAFGVIAQEQGASGVIARLWSVADESTSKLMEQFYQVWSASAGVSKAEALREAQLAMLHDSAAAPRGQETRGIRLSDAGPAPLPRYAHPFYWAPFFVMGNWR
jgi:CHAT domain-containing protein/tetratricopeptide (TPR) repeat protein